MAECEASTSAEGKVGGDREMGREEFVRTVNDDCWYLESKLGAYKVEWLVDCGANPNILSVKVFEQFGKKKRNTLKPTDTKLVAANGDTIVTHGQVTIDIDLQGTVFSLPVIVADIGETAGILGMQFLRGTGCSVSFREGILRCGRQEWKLTGPSTPGVHRVNLVSVVRLPPGEGMRVAGTVQGLVGGKEWDGVLEPVTSDTGATTPPCVVHVRTQSSTEVDVWNVSDKELVLLPGTTIGHVEQISEICQQTDSSTHMVNSVRAEPEASKLPDHLTELAADAYRHLTDKQRTSVENLLIKHVDAFMAPGGKMGNTDLVSHSIDTGDAKPVKTPYRPPAFAKRQIIEENIDKMLADGVIEPSTSAWSAPIVLVKKKDNTYRFCVDLRRLNQVTRKDAYPLPNINDCLSSLSGAQWFCTLDLASGYWQMDMSECSKEKTAFSSHRGLYHFKKMPFGLTNAPASFMRLMELVLGELAWERCLVYLDDIIVFGSSFEQCLSNITAVMERLQAAGLKLKPSKCNLFQTEVAFLGHRVGRDGIGCDPAKIETVHQWPTPRNVAEVRSFLGLANYYKRFVNQFSDIAKPLTSLTQKGTVFEWGEKCDESFQALKTALTQTPILAYPSLDPTAEFILDTDASNFGIGAVLSQVQNGTERVISYASKTLTHSQRNYCTTYRELLALVEFIPYFKHYLLGQRFTVRTDHSSLRWLYNFKEAEGLVGRWIAKLANYDFAIEHRAGVDHGNADAMSRNPLLKHRRRCGRDACPDCTGNNPTPIKCGMSVTSGQVGTANAVNTGSDPNDMSQHDSNWANNWSVTELQDFQREDPAIQTVVSWIKAGKGKPRRAEINRHGADVKDLCGVWSTLVIENQLLYRRWNSTSVGSVLQLVTPPPMRAIIFRHVHASRVGGHLGRRRTMLSVRRRFFWPKAKSDIHRWCKECDECAKVKDRPSHRAKLQQELVGGRFDRVAIDIMGELPETAAGNKYILVLSDYFTKWTQAFALKDQTAFTVADVLMTNCFNLFGMPRWIHSDQGRNFESELFAELCKLLEIRKTRTTPYHPQSDGMVERFNRTCQQMLKIFVNENRSDWDEHLPYVLMAYRSTPHDSTGLSPNLMMFGEETHLPIDILVGAPPRHDVRYKCKVEYVEWLRRSLSRAHTFAHQQLGVAAKRQKQYYDRKTDTVTYPVSCFVWWWYPPKANRKLGVGWTGPFRVMDRPTDVHAVIQELPGSNTRRVHINQLKPHLGKTPGEWADWIDSDISTSAPDAEDLDAEIVVDAAGASDSEERGAEQLIEAAIASDTADLEAEIVVEATEAPDAAELGAETWYEAAEALDTDELGAQNSSDAVEGSDTEIGVEAAEAEEAVNRPMVIAPSSPPPIRRSERTPKPVRRWITEV